MNVDGGDEGALSSGLRSGMNVDGGTSMSMRPGGGCWLVQGSGDAGSSGLRSGMNVDGGGIDC